MKNDEISAIRDEEILVAEELFNGKCFACTRKITRITPKTKKIKKSFKGFTFHHLEYYIGEPRRKFYPKGSQGTFPYKRDVLKIIKLHPNEFVLVCNIHHHTIEDILRIYQHHTDWVSNIMDVVKRTDTKESKRRINNVLIKYYKINLIIRLYQTR